jgi:hypothetical protein
MSQILLSQTGQTARWLAYSEARCQLLVKLIQMPPLTVMVGGRWPVAALHHHPLVSQLDFLLLIMRDLDYDDATSIDVNNSIDADDGDNNNNNNDNNDTANANPKMN